MRFLIFFLTVSLTVLAGCKREEPMPKDPAEIVVSTGETYDGVINKLGSPNIDSFSDQSRVLIYDKIEIKLKDGVVVEVFDHR